MATPMTAKSSMSAIEQLKNACAKGLFCKMITLTDGSMMKICWRAMTLAEDEKVRKMVADAPSHEYASYALNLLIQRGLDDQGNRLFDIGHIVDLKHAVDQRDLQALMTAMLNGDGEQIDSKSA